MPVHSTTFLICVVFSFITPILPIVGLVYFTMARNYAAYNLTYMSTPQFNAGGLMWTNIHAHVMAALVTLQLIATFSFGLKEAPGPSALSFVLVLPTVLYWKSSTARLEEPIKKLPLKGAQEIDALQEREGVTKPAQGLYLHPGMAVTDETIDATVRECERMLGVVGRYEDGPEGRMAAKGMVEEGRGVERMEA